LIRTKSGDLEIRSELISLFNIQNILAAVATGLAMDVEMEAIKQGISNLSYIPGRLEKYAIGEESYAVVDYAHTPDALQKAAEALNQIKKERLIIVFGCGGDRDRKKRPVMGQIAEELGDFIIITNDNPRKEEPGQIINDIVKGMTKKKNFLVIEDRKKAILHGLNMAGPGDIILIAGKGHESYQILGEEKVEFNEPLIIQEALTNA
jgi:UDP-N-acetylmuramoyl-L-alanyl-D-glutamate--2,6-diaminopimelate ligase